LDQAYESDLAQHQLGITTQGGDAASFDSGDADSDGAARLEHSLEMVIEALEY